MDKEDIVMKNIIRHTYHCIAALFILASCQSAYTMQKNNNASASQPASAIVLQCLSCNHEPFKTQQVLDEHIEAIHKGRYYNCPFSESCLETIAYITHLNRHMEQYHVGESYNLTELYGKMRANPQYGTPTHQQQRLPRNAQGYECPACTHKPFKDFTAAKEHHEIDHRGRYFKCPECGATIVYPAQIESHRVKCHKDLTDKKKFGKEVRSQAFYCKPDVEEFKRTTNECTPSVNKKKKRPTTPPPSPIATTTKQSNDYVDRVSIILDGDNDDNELDDCNMESLSLQSDDNQKAAKKVRISTSNIFDDVIENNFGIGDDNDDDDNDDNNDTFEKLPTEQQTKLMALLNPEFITNNNGGQ